MAQSLEAFVVDVRGGSLGVLDLTDGVAARDAPMVLAAHGITANGLMWQPVADELSRRRGPGAVRFLAPDLRGRALSRGVQGPFGLAAHAADLVAVAELAGASREHSRQPEHSGRSGVRPVLLGHSMGAFIVALTAATAPGRFASAVLVDGGLAFPAPPDLDIDAALTAVIGPAMDRLGMRFPSREAYLDFWAGHPALGASLSGPAGPSVRRYILHDLIDAGGGDWMSSCVLDAVRADGADVLADQRTHGSVREAVSHGLPLEFVWAARGLLDEPQGLYDETRLAALAVPSEVRVTAVDANHYTVVLGEAGVRTVVDALERQLDGQ